jgi:hypothetical protein
LRLGNIRAIKRSTTDAGVVLVFPHFGEEVAVMADFDVIRQRLIDAGKVLP